MENTRDDANRSDINWSDWSKEDSEELVMLYLEDYYKSLDDYYLREALQIAKDDGINIQKIMQVAKSRMN